MNFLSKKVVLGFLGGILAGEVLKTKSARELAVKGVAGSMKMTRKVQASVQSIKEDAEDLCAEDAELVNE